MKDNNFMKKLIIYILFSFNVIFPKGGIKVGDIPITWGILILIIIGLIIFLKKFLKKKYIPSVSAKRSIIIIFWIPFQLLCAIAFFFNGIENIEMCLAFIFVIYFLPWIMLGVLGKGFAGISINEICNVLKISIMFISLYGIFLFTYRIIFGEYIELPYLTVNFNDIGTLEGKNNDRLGIFKLISTYNNGNIYGVCAVSYTHLFGIVAIEAMKNKKAIIASNRGALPELIQNGKNGYIFDMDNLSIFPILY